MDFLDPKKKRSHTIRLYVGYVLMGIALTIATLILVFAAYGYGFDRQTGDIIQNGLILVDAHPESARVLVNGEDKGVTDSRLVLPADRYTIELRRDGYRSWKRDVDLEGSSIEQLVYPFLYPERLVSKTLQTYEAIPMMASESPDRKWLVISVPAAVGSFQVIDLGDDEHPVTTVGLPADTLTTTSNVHRFEEVEWSTDNSHLLIKHTFETGSEFIMLDRQNPANSVNLNKVFSTTTFNAVTLRDKKFDQLHLHNTADGALYFGESRTRNVTRIRDGVVAYKSYLDDTILYVTHPANTELAEVRIRQDDQDFLVRTVTKSDVYFLDMARFNDNFYLVAGSKTDSRAYIYRDPFASLTRKPSRTPQPFRVLITPGAEYVSFSAIARFIALQGGSSFAVYDAETGRQFRYDTKLTLLPAQKATWMDGHRLVLNSQNNIHVFDFDGTNQHLLTSALPGFKPFFDRDYLALFTLAPDTAAPTKVNLSRTELKVLTENTTN